MKRRLANRGVALITALVFVFLAAVLAAKMQWQTAVDLSRTTTLVQSDQAMEVALGAEAWAEQILRRDYQQNPNATTLAQDWAQQLPPLPVGEGSQTIGQVAGHLEDLQGRFNLNNLAGGNAASLQQFQRLLAALNLDPLLANAVSDWVNAGIDANPMGGAKDDTYTRLQPPYLTADQPMTSVSELMLVKGVTPQVYAALAPFVCALPAQAPAGAAAQAGTPVNINTASGPVLMSLDPHVTADVASQIIGMRGDNGFNSPQQAQQALNGIALPPTAGVTSSYFLLTATAEIGTTQLTLYSLLYRNGGKVTAVRRTFGTL